MQGEFARACANILATFFSDSPTTLDRTCDPFDAIVRFQMIPAMHYQRSTHLNKHEVDTQLRA
jgi:hypothetical protein